MNVADTIAAIASAPGGALRGVIRLSGPDVVACLARCFCVTPAEEDFGTRLPNRRPDDPPAQNLLAAIRRATVVDGDLLVGAPLNALPCALYLWPTSRSYTRQPTAELHTLGSPPLLEAALRAVCQAGARLAAPGEFTLRAFLGGRLDLTQAEAVLGVIDAHDRQELHVALAQLAGGLAHPLADLRNRLLDLLAHLEAGLDFADEDLELITREQLETQLSSAAERIARLTEQMTSRGEIAAEYRVVLQGWPNVGKSSLFNALAGESAALVSDVAGTTRDYVATTVELAGLPCRLVDTAGVEPTPRRGFAATAQSLTAQQVQQADVQLLCLDATRPLNDWERAALEQEADERRILVLTKTDGVRATDLHLPAVETSSVSGRGLLRLRAAIVRQATVSRCQAAPVVAGTAVRCQESLRLAAEGLRQARVAAEAALGEELVAADLRGALEELGKIVGTVCTEEVLDRIFSRFCIGK